ncbi:YpoC family protein [Bacillus sp. OHL2]
MDQRESVQTFEWEHIKQETFPVAPINWTERLEFILLKPTQYHCFIQLDELYTELKKQYGKYEALKKSDSSVKKSTCQGGKCFFIIHLLFEK